MRFRPGSGLVLEVQDGWKEWKGGDSIGGGRCSYWLVDWWNVLLRSGGVCSMAIGSIAAVCLVPSGLIRLA